MPAALPTDKSGLTGVITQLHPGCVALLQRHILLRTLVKREISATAGPIKGPSQTAFRLVPDWDFLEAYRS